MLITNAYATTVDRASRSARATELTSNHAIRASIAARSFSSAAISRGASLASLAVSVSARRLIASVAFWLHGRSDRTQASCSLSKTWGDKSSANPLSTASRAVQSLPARQESVRRTARATHHQCERVLLPVFTLQRVPHHSAVWWIL